MRLHQLGITAFGPFAGECEVDLEELSRSGLFLIQGPTGAGKTSILDAICFALYAALPGARSGARASLRSDHAAEGAVPQVRLEFTASGRRFEVVRSPEFQRPKKRGTGTTKVQASVVLEELVEGSWVNRGTRNDEVAQVIQDVVGMGLEQFIKVVLLPQGDFAAFLRANPEDRRAVLAKLFDTSRFTDIEAWLTERRRDLAAGLAEARADLARHLAQVDTAVELLDLGEAQDDADGDADADADVTPDEAAASADGAAADADPLVLPDWSELPRTEVGPALTALQAAVSQHAGAALAARSLAEGRHEAADAALHAGRRTAELQEAAARAVTELEALASAGPAYEAATTTIAAARRAAAVTGHLSAADDAAASRAAAEEEVVARATPLAADLGWEPAGDALPALEAVEALAGRLEAASAPLDRAVAVADSLSDLAAEVERHTRDADTREQGAADVAGELTTATQRAEEAAARLVTLRQRAATAGTLESRVERVTRSHRLQAEQDRARPRLAELESALAQARAATLDAREVAVSLRERRLTGMAGELAAGLHEGDPCPVCGACEHPSPARHTDVVTAAEVDAAEGVVAEAAAAETALAGEVAALSAAIAARAEELTGVDQSTDELATELEDARHEWEQARTAGAALAAAEVQAAELAAGVEALRTHQGELLSGRDTARALAAASRTRLEDSTALSRTLLAEHDADCPCAVGVGGHGEPDLDRADRGDANPDGVGTDGEGPDGTGRDGTGRDGDRPDDHGDPGSSPLLRAEAHEAFADEVRELAQAVRTLATAASTAEATAARLRESLQQGGFPDVDAVRAAAVPEAQVRELEAQVREVDRRRDQATARLAEPEVVAARRAPAPDLQHLTEERDSTARSLGAARDRHTLAERASSQLRQLGAAVTAVLDRLGPAEDEAALVQEVADCVAGTSANNALRMRLSSYVLAARLEEVTLLANERLRTMSDGRYALEYTDALAARGARSGLGLRVRDAWTGLPRDTSTLSGGEAFMASLALALGLGDAVKAEAGGLDLQTLFVDEGFGTLDEESLEQVMAVLDGLREGGRAVGIVSHVAELRQRIPVQLRVSKTQRGSEVSVTLEDESAA